LWCALEPAERLAVLAHETAHFTNNDPARGRLPAAALMTLSNWIDIFDPPELIDHGENEIIIIDDRDLMGRILGGTFGNFFKAITYAYERLVFADSQRAEYLADINAAKVSGKIAKQSALKKLIILPLANQALVKTYYDGGKHIPLFEIMAQAIHDPDPEQVQKRYVEAAKTLHTIDSSHPPTRFRLEVVGAAGYEKAALNIHSYDWGKIDAELSSHFTKIEADMLSSMIIQ
jgi:Zn-dependent protease with chaperone function